ncbi:MAG: shikimate kinase [Thermodesulfovibrionales bacterium]|nr:shikimate kinase [Thermodesulfovibrionales bacterium]
MVITKNIVLTGFMGTGKSEVGRVLAEKLSFDFLDSDAEIEKRENMSITQIFTNYGERKFRDIEADIIRELSEKEKVVISTGGGVVLRQSNMLNLRKKGIVVCLTASAETILQRVKDTDDRPLLKGDDPLGRIRELLEYRTPFYGDADITINTENKTPEEIASEIIEKLRHRNF